jgi:hypothetical protein
MASSEIEMPFLTGRQANVMDHAVAFPKLSRNGFEATDGLANDDTWKELVALGYARRVESFAVSGKTKYEVTEAGIKTLQTFHEAKANELEASTTPSPL